MKTSEVLNKAADLIEQRGWVQGWTGWRGTNGLCLEGGVAAALGIDASNGMNEKMYAEFQACPAYIAVCDYLAYRPENPLDGVWSWNDQDDRTKEEVIEVLRAAALIEAAKENQSLKVEVMV